MHEHTPRGRGRRRRERQKIVQDIQRLTEQNSENCSLCGAPFPHNSRTYGGVGPDGGAALVGGCCSARLEAIHGFGVYCLNGGVTTGLHLPEPRSPEECIASVAAIQEVIRDSEPLLHAMFDLVFSGAGNGEIKAADLEALTLEYAEAFYLGRAS